MVTKAIPQNDVEIIDSKTARNIRRDNNSKKITIVSLKRRSSSKFSSEAERLMKSGIDQIVIWTRKIAESAESIYNKRFVNRYSEVDVEPIKFDYFKLQRRVEAEYRNLTRKIKGISDSIRNNTFFFID